MGLRVVKNGDERGDAALNDIPGMLRKAADRIEQGLDTRPATMVWVAYYDDEEVAVGAFGDCPSKLELVGLLELAKQLMSPEPGGTTRG